MRIYSTQLSKIFLYRKIWCSYTNYRITGIQIFHFSSCEKIYNYCADIKLHIHNNIFTLGSLGS